MIRPSGRKENELRDISITRKYTTHAEGSVLIQYGETKVICTASVVDGVPPFLRGQKKGGWLTAEYGMLPRATNERTQREAARGKQTGRTQEIQRLIGRSLRQAIDLSKLKEYTIQLDCDVIQADGGTRTAAITGACVALYDAIQHMKQFGKIKSDPFNYFVAAVSVGIHDGIPVLDLDYHEDSNAHTDMNIVMNQHGKFIEIQGTAESNPFSAQELVAMTTLAKNGLDEIIRKQNLAIES